MGPIENYKNLLSWSDFIGREVSGLQLVMHCSGSISVMYSTMLSGFHSNGRNKWDVCKI